MKPALLDLARLVRLPNAFTAMADICLWAVVTGASKPPILRFKSGFVDLKHFKCLPCRIFVDHARSVHLGKIPRTFQKSRRPW